MMDDWGTVAPKRSHIEQTGHMVRQPTKPPPIEPNYMAYWGVTPPKEPLWLSLWKHDLFKDMELWLWQCRLVETLDLIIDRRLKDEKMQTCL